MGKSRSLKVLPFALLLLLFSLNAAVSGSPLPTKSLPANTELTFKQNQQRAFDLEQEGHRSEALALVRNTLQSLQRLPPYCDHISQLRVREAELELQTRMETECYRSVKKIIQDAPKIRSGAGADGELWLELGYLEDLLVRHAAEGDSLDGFKLASDICQNFKEIRCRPKETIEPLCRSEIRHKDWIGLETSASQLSALADNPLTQLTALSMLELTLSKQKKQAQAKKVAERLQKLSPGPDLDERIRHRDAALVQYSVLNHNLALKEIDAALVLDKRLPAVSKKTQIATDLGIKAEIELVSGQLDNAIKDATEADKVWVSLDPSIWKSASSSTFTHCHVDALAVLEQAFQAKKLPDQASEARNRRRQLLYVK